MDGHSYSLPRGTRTTDYLGAAMSDAVRFRSALGIVREYPVGVLEIDKEGCVIGSGNIMKPESIKFLPLKVSRPNILT